MVCFFVEIKRIKTELWNKILITVLMFAYIFNLTECLYDFEVLGNLLSIWLGRPFLTIFLGVVFINSLWFWFFFFLVNVLISPSFEGQFWPDIVFLVDGFCLFSPLNISFYCLLTCKVSARKSADNPIGYTLYMRSWLFLAGFIILFFYCLLTVWL